jgi:hypothetical protein
LRILRQKKYAAFLQRSLNGFFVWSGAPVFTTIPRNVASKRDFNRIDIPGQAPAGR